MKSSKAIQILQRNCNLGYGIIIEGDTAKINEALRLAVEALKARPQGEWIPVSKKLPDDLEPVNITYIDHKFESYYKEIKDKPFTATGVYFNGQWYWWSSLCTDTLAAYSHNFDDIIDEAVVEVIAWMPLPEP